MKILILGLCSLFLIQLTFAQQSAKTSGQNIFLFSYSDSMYDSYVYRTKEGSVVIEIYNDSLFGLHSYAVVDNTGKISAGKWDVKNDSILILKSDESLKTEFYFRRDRSLPIEKYDFLNLEYKAFIIPKKRIAMSKIRSSGEAFRQ